MRTTVDLDSAILDKIKKRAARLHLSISDYLAMAVVEDINRTRSKNDAQPAFELIEAGTAGAHPKASWEELTRSAADIAGDLI